MLSIATRHGLAALLLLASGSVAAMEAKGWKGYDVHSCDGCCYTGGSVRYE